MRVIGGSLRSRRLVAPAGEATRPSSDRLRETLFNVLAPRMEGCRFLDLYAGSGAVGIEALSRGARRAWMVERAPAAMRALRANVAAMGVGAAARVEERGVGAALERMLGAGQERFDVVFLDPPYEDAAAYAGTLGWLGGVGMALLAEGAVVVAEHRSKAGLAEVYGELRRRRELRKGEATLSFFSV